MFSYYHEMNRKYGHLTVEQYNQAMREGQQRALSRASDSSSTYLDTGSGSGRGFTFEVNDIRTMQHIRSIFRAVDERNIEELDALIGQNIAVHQSYTDYTVPVRDVVAALEHALDYAELNGLTAVVNTIAGRTICAQYIPYSQTVRDADVVYEEEYSSTFSPR